MPFLPPNQQRQSNEGTEVETNTSIIYFNNVIWLCLSQLWVKNTQKSNTTKVHHMKHSRRMQHCRLTLRSQYYTNDTWGWLWHSNRMFQSWNFTIRTKPEIWHFNKGCAIATLYTALWIICSVKWPTAKMSIFAQHCLASWVEVCSKHHYISLQNRYLK